MCRTGGRRCPSHSNPEAVSARNARRRAAYGSKKASSSTETPTGSEGVRIASELLKKNAWMFDDYSQVKYRFDDSHDNWSQYLEDADEFYEILKSKAPEGESSPHIRVLKNYYTGEGYRGIRDYLNDYDVANGKPREFDPKYEEEDRAAEKEEMDEIIPLLDEAISLAPKSEFRRQLYRGMNLPSNIKSEDVSSWIHENFPVGGVVSQKSYMSTSLSADRAVLNFTNRWPRMHDRTVVFEIISNEGAVLGDETALHGSKEAEVLMPRNKKFRVLSIDENVTYTTSGFSEGFSDAPEDTSPTQKTVIRMIDA
jgi:hypothetical protein